MTSNTNTNPTPAQPEQRVDRLLRAQAHAQVEPAPPGLTDSIKQELLSATQQTTRTTPRRPIIASIGGFALPAAAAVAIATLLWTSAPAPQPRQTTSNLAQLSQRFDLFASDLRRKTIIEPTQRLENTYTREFEAERDALVRSGARLTNAVLDRFPVRIRLGS